jgi:tripartite-type tricarboxylate transporter receptor subunit TctC
MKFIRTVFHALIILTVVLALVEVATAGNYPSKPITLVVPYAPGGGGDAFTRAIALQAQAILGAKIFVENRMGGGATIGVGTVARARADGYTLGFVSSSPVVAAPNFFNVPYDPAKDLTYLSRFIISAAPVLVRGDSKFQSFRDLIVYAKANPGKLLWSTAGINGAPHIATEAAFTQEGIKSAFLPMQGSTEVLAALLGGTIAMGVMSDYAGPLAAGDVRALADIGSERVPDLAEIPTYREMGYALTPTIFFGLAGPAGLPAEVISTWDHTMRTITASAAFIEVAKRLNGNVAYLDHKAFQAMVLDEIGTMRETLQSLEVPK